VTTGIPWTGQDHAKAGHAQRREPARSGAL